MQDEFQRLMQVCYDLAYDASGRFKHPHRGGGTVYDSDQAARFGAVLFEHCLRNDITTEQLTKKPE